MTEQPIDFYDKHEQNLTVEHDKTSNVFYLSIGSTQYEQPFVLDYETAKKLTNFLQSSIGIKLLKKMSRDKYAKTRLQQIEDEDD